MGMPSGGPAKDMRFWASVRVLAKSLARVFAEARRIGGEIRQGGNIEDYPEIVDMHLCPFYHFCARCLWGESLGGSHLLEECCCDATENPGLW